MTERKATTHCFPLWTVLLLLFLGDLATIEIVVPRSQDAVDTHWHVFTGILRIAALPFIHPVLGCG
jgi:hypothetical protein